MFGTQSALHSNMYEFGSVAIFLIVITNLVTCVNAQGYGGGSVPTGNPGVYAQPGLLPPGPQNTGSFPSSDSSPAPFPLPPGSSQDVFQPAAQRRPFRFSNQPQGVSQNIPSQSQLNTSEGQNVQSSNGNLTASTNLGSNPSFLARNQQLPSTWGRERGSSLPSFDSTAGTGNPVKQLFPSPPQFPGQQSQQLLLGPGGGYGNAGTGTGCTNPAGCGPAPVPGGSYGGTPGGGGCNGAAGCSIGGQQPQPGYPSGGGTPAGTGYGNPAPAPNYVLQYGMTSGGSDGGGYGGNGGGGRHAQLAPGTYYIFGPPYNNLGPATGSGGCCGGNSGQGPSNGYVPGGAVFAGNSQNYGPSPGGGLPGCGPGTGCGTGGQQPSAGYGNNGGTGGTGCSVPGGCPTLPGQDQVPGGAYPSAGGGCTTPGGCQSLPSQNQNLGGSYQGGGGGNVGGSGCSTPGGCPTLPGSGCGSSPSGCGTGPTNPGTGYGGDSGGVGRWSEWSSWGDCRYSSQYRSRNCDYGQSIGQVGCFGRSYESQPCNNNGAGCSLFGTGCGARGGGYPSGYVFRRKLRE